MAQSYYPVALDVEGKRCLVVGGGTIATDKVECLLAARADVVVVSPHAGARIEQLAAEKHIQLHLRPYRPDDVRGAFLVIAATDQVEANARVAADARAAAILVNAVDDPPNCDFFAVSVVRRGDLQIAISTNGRSPAFARWMREYLEEWLPTEFEDLLAVLADVRQAVKSRGAIPPYEHWQAAITDDVLVRLRHGDRAGARDRILEAVEDAPATVTPATGYPVAAGRLEG